MSFITVSSLTKSFGAMDLFTNISFTVAKGSRLALVGPNGVGKTTLLRIIVGADEASSGEVHRARGARIGYLPQEADFEMSGTLWDACLHVFSELIARQEELHRLEVQMADAAQAESVMLRYGKLQEEFERRGGYTYATRIKQVLTGLGFGEADYTLSLDHLSGGQRTRAYRRAYCYRTLICYCSMNRLIISTLPRSYGWKVISHNGMARQWSSRMIVIFSIKPAT